MINHTPSLRTGPSFIETRRARVASVLAGDAQCVGSGADPLSPEPLEHLVREAEELYWNELTWEELTDEEVIVGGHLTELVFPGFLAFVDGLLVDEVLPGSLVPARPHPDAVEEVLAFLGRRFADLSAELDGGIDSQRVLWARAMTAQLVDLVLCRLYRISPAELEALGAQA
ncbi:MAG: hypothetical protein M3409_08260 [Gemmatimonadota bacterium]|nr:hypothetical protein [Gemmatimonadota bacterium]